MAACVGDLKHIHKATRRQALAGSAANREASRLLREMAI